MKKLAYLSIILISFAGCEDTPNASQGPCPVPPAESNFPVFPEPGVFCKDCYFTIEFRGEEYSFKGNQLKTKWTGLSEAHNSFFSFYLAPPSTVEELYNSIDVKTPLLSLDTVFNTDPDSISHDISAAIGIYN